MSIYKLTILVCCFFISQGVFSQDKHENNQSIIAGLGPSLELNNSLAGVNDRVYYGVNKSFCFGPEISYFPFQNIEDDYQKSIIDLNLNAHYIFELSENLGFHPLTGVNYTIEKERLIDHNNKYLQEKEWGLNYGIGIHYKLKNTFIFTEFKGITGHLPA